MNRPGLNSDRIPDFLRSAELLVTSVVTIGHFLLLSAGDAVFPPEVLFISFFFTLVLFPGYIVSRILFTRLDMVFRMMISFLAGVSLFFAVLIIFSLAGLNIRIAGYLIPGMTLGVVFARGLMSTSGLGLPGCEMDVGHRYSTLTVVVLLIVVVGAAALVLVHGDPMLLTSDSPDHIAYIRAVARSEEVFPPDFLYEDGGLLTRDIRKGMAHSLWGTLASLTGSRDIVPLWNVVSAIGSVFNIMAFFCAGILLFGSPAVGLLSALIMVLIHYDGLADFKLVYTAYGFPFGKIFLILYLSFLVLYIRAGRRSHLVPAALASFAASSTHIGHFIVSMFLLVVISTGQWIEERGRGSSRFQLRLFLAAALSTISINAPYILMRYIRDYSPDNSLHTHMQGLLEFSDAVWIVNPMIAFRPMMPLAILVFISLFLLWKGSARDRNLRLLIWGTIAIYATLFNPLIAPLAAKVISYMILRFVSAVPPAIMAAYLIREIWRRLTGHRAVVSRRGAIIGLVAVIVLFGSVLAKTPGRFAYRKGSVPQEATCRNMSDLYTFLGEEVAAGSVIASDPVTSFTIPAFTDDYVVCTYDQHSVPNDSTALERILDCRDLFFSGTPPARISRILRDYGVDYIVVNGRIPKSTEVMFWSLRKEQADSAMARFSRLPFLSGPVYRDRSLAVFKVGEITCLDIAGDGLPHRSAGSETAVIDGNDAGRFISSGIDGIKIAKIEFKKGPVLRGSTLPVSIDWVAIDHCEPGSYRVFMRFNTEFDRTSLYNEAYGKIYRKLLEKREGTRYRFRAEWQPLSGLYPPDMWPTGTVISDSIGIRIPADIHPGTYDVTVKLIKTTKYPNYRLSDLLSDHDYYQGEEVGHVVIK